MQSGKKFQPTKWDTAAKRSGKRLSKRERSAYLRFYESRMAQGYNRQEILATLAKNISVSDRQVERIISQARDYEQKIKEHHTALSIVALSLASNLATLLNTSLFTEKMGIVVYGGVVSEIDSGQSVCMQRVDKHMALNLLCHLKEDVRELADIDDWAELATGAITEVLILRLKQRGNRGNFSSKCPDCPR